jgi:hypothetical protein
MYHRINYQTPEWIIKGNCMETICIIDNEIYLYCARNLSMIFSSIKSHNNYKMLKKNKNPNKNIFMPNIT